MLFENRLSNSVKVTSQFKFWNNLFKKYLLGGTITTIKYILLPKVLFEINNTNCGIMKINETKIFTCCCVDVLLRVILQTGNYKDSSIDYICSRLIVLKCILFAHQTVPYYTIYSALPEQSSPDTAFRKAFFTYIIFTMSIL